MLHMTRDDLTETARRHAEVWRECETILKALDRAGLLAHGAEGCRLTGWAMRGETLVLGYRDTEGDDGEQEMSGAVLFMSDRAREAWVESRLSRLGQVEVERMAREAMAQRDARIERERAMLRRLAEKHPDALAG
jgi:hypothetical protein